MRRRIWTALAAITTGSLMLGLCVSPAVAMPPPDWPDPDPVPHCRPGYHWDDDVNRCVPNGPPPPRRNDPTVAIDLARQTHTRDGIHVVGWAADADEPGTALTIHIRVDDGPPTDVTANGDRPDVATANPGYGAAHGYDAVVPAGANARRVCVTASNVGSGQDRSTCAEVDAIVGFEATDIRFDTDRAVITNVSVEQVDQLSQTNKSTVQQTTEMSGSRTFTDTRGWSDTFGVKVSVSTAIEIKLPVLADKRINLSVEGSATFAQNGSTTQSNTVSWRQPILVPAKSRVDAAVTVSHATLRVPYTMVGEYVYAGGAREHGAAPGIYTGANSYGLDVSIAQYDLDGTAAALPAPQPPPTLRLTAE